MDKKTANINSSEQEKFTDEKKRKYRKITKKITSQIQWALILHKLKTWNNWNPDVAQLSYDQDWNIMESRGKDIQKKWAVDILWQIEDINILNIRDELYELIDSSREIKNEDKWRLKKSIKLFIEKQLLLPRINI